MSRRKGHKDIIDERDRKVRKTIRLEKWVSDLVNEKIGKGKRFEFYRESIKNAILTWKKED